MNRDELIPDAEGDRGRSKGPQGVDRDALKEQPGAERSPRVQSQTSKGPEPAEPRVPLETCAPPAASTPPAAALSDAESELPPIHPEELLQRVAKCGCFNVGERWNCPCISCEAKRVVRARPAPAPEPDAALRKRAEEIWRQVCRPTLGENALPMPQTIDAMLEFGAEREAAIHGETVDSPEVVRRIADVRARFGPHLAREAKLEDLLREANTWLDDRVPVRLRNQIDAALAPAGEKEQK